MITVMVSIMVSIMITVVTSVVVIRLVALRVLSTLGYCTMLKLCGITSTNIPALQHYQPQCHIENGWVRKTHSLAFWIEITTYLLLTALLQEFMAAILIIQINTTLVNFFLVVATAMLSVAAMVIIITIIVVVVISVVENVHTASVVVASMTSMASVASVFVVVVLTVLVFIVVPATLEVCQLCTK